MNKLEKTFDYVKGKEDIKKTSIICLSLFTKTEYDFRVFISISIPIMTRYDPYENDSLVMSLNVEENGKIEKWLEMKKNLVFEGGFGVFALRDFSTKEFVTVYLGQKIDKTYIFGDIDVLGLSKNFKTSGFQEEYWLGHRINHGSGGKNNLEIKNRTVFRATKKIKCGEELYWDYNRNCFCMNCNKWEHYFTECWIQVKKCCKCQNHRNSEKYCNRCNGYICVECYDSFQIEV